MIAQSPEHAIELIDKAFQEADVEALMSLYDDSAVQVDYVVAADGTEIRGKQALREMYAGLLRPGLFTVKQIKTHVVEADGIALFTSKLSLSFGEKEPRTYVATIVFRRQPDGSWKDLIDSSPSVLDM
ncbi:YybH family protein [Pseudochelatococcus sp. B33]